MPPDAPPVSIVDMNDLPKGVCRPDMGSYEANIDMCCLSTQTRKQTCYTNKNNVGSYEAAILLPHNPAPIRLIDFYAQECAYVNRCMYIL